MKSRLRTHAPALLLWTLLWAATFAGPLAGTHHLRGGDTTGQYYAFALFQSREMRQLGWPVWSPGSYGGFPFAADVQSAAFYPPRWATILLAAPWGELPYHALEIEVLTHLWLAGVGAYLLAYALTRDRWAGVLAAVAWALGGYLTGYPLLQFPILETATWLPWALWALHRASQAERPWRWLGSAAAFLALGATAGHPQTWLQGAYLCAGYYLFATMRAHWAWRNILLLGVGIGVLTAGLTAPVWLPALRYLPFTSRQEVGYDFVSSGMPALDWLQAALPGAWTAWSPQYFGVSGLLCAALGWLRRRAEPAWARHEASFWGCVALLGAWLSLGDKGVLFRLAYHALPGLGVFRQQERWALWWAFGASVLAGLGLAAWRRDAPNARRALGWAAACTLGLVCTATLVKIAQGQPWDAWGPLALRQAGLLAAIAALLAWNSAYTHVRWRRAASGALLTLLALDLALVARSTGNVRPGSPAQYWPDAPWLHTLATPGGGRIQAHGVLHANLGEIYGLEDTAGISPLRPKALDTLRKLAPPRAWQLLGVEYILSPTRLEGPDLTLLREVPAATLPGQEPPAYLYRYGAALARATLYTHVLRAEGEAQMWTLVRAPEFDPEREIVLGPDAPRLPGEASGGQAAAQVRVARQDARTLAITVDTPIDAYLLVREWFYPGWRAWLDGVSAPIQRANGAWQAIYVPVGRHQLRVRYMAFDELWGALCAACMLFAGGLTFWRWRPIIRLRTNTWPIQAPSALPTTRVAWQPSSWWCLGLTLLALALRAYRLGYQELSSDEAVTYLLARLPPRDILPALLRQDGPQAPLPYLLLHGWAQLFGRGEFALRLPSLLCSALLTPTMWRLGARLADRRLALLLALASALSQSQVWLGQDVRLAETLTVLLTAWAMLGLLRAIERPHWGRWLLYSAGCAACLSSSSVSVFILVGHGLYLAALRGRRGTLGRWAASLLLALALLGPWLVAAWPQIVAAWGALNPDPPELTTYLFRAGTWLALGTDVPRQVGQLLLLTTGAITVVGAQALWRHQRPLAALCLGWSVSMVAGLYLAQLRGFKVDLRVIACAAPALWLLEAYGLLALWRRRAPWARGLALAALLLWAGVNGWQLYRYYADPDAGRSEGYRPAAARLRTAAGPGDVLLIDAPDPRWDYYLERTPVAWTPVAQAARVGDAELEALAIRYARLWLATSRGKKDGGPSPEQFWLNSHALLLEQSTFDRQQLALFRPLRLVGQEMIPLDATWGAAAHLRGYALLVNGHLPMGDSPWSLPAGANLQVTLLWEARASIPQDYTVFVHLLGADGRLLAQHDGAPVFGERPTSSWQAGELLLDRHELTLPPDLPAQAATLVAGLYRSDTLARWPLPDGRDTLPLGAISIAP